MKNFIIIISFIFILIWSHSDSQDIEQCSYFTKKYERVYNLPNNLLTSIALVESGIKKKQNHYTSWPWTLNVSGKSFYFDHRNELLDFLALNFTPKKSIDVGCMQLNYRWHKVAFSSIEEMMDPELNIKYAAQFVHELYGRHKNWEDVIKHYHSNKKKLMYHTFKK